MANLADLTVSVGTKLGEFTAGMRRIPEKAGEAADGVVGKFRQMAPKLEAAAKAGAVAAGAAIVVGATEGLEREALGDKLAAQLRLSESDSKAAGKIAGDIYGKAYGESLGQVNEAVAGVVGGGLAELGDTAAVERLTTKALDLAATFDGDVTDGVARASALIDSGLAGDADEAFDLIIASSQKVTPALRDELGDATKEYSKHFADLGFSGSEALGLLSSASDQFTLDKTGDAIKELSIRATDMSTATVDAFAKIAGIDVSAIDTSTDEGKEAMQSLTTTAETMSNRLLAGGDSARGAFDQIVDGLLAIQDPTEQANAAIALFGTPLEDLGTAQIPGFLESLDGMGGGLGDVAGRADELGDTLNSNGKTRVESFKRKFEGMLAQVTEAPGILGDAAVAVGGIGQVLEPIGPAVAGAGYIFREQLGSMAKAAGSGMGKAAKAVASGASSAVVGLLRWTLAGATWAAQMVAQGARAAASMVRTAAQFAAKYAFMAAQAAANAARMAASWIVAMGPVGWVIAAVVALVAVIVKNWDTIKEWTGKAWDWVAEKTSAVFGAVVDFVRDVWDRITGHIRTAVDTVRNVVSSAWEAVVGAVRRYVDLMLTIYVKIPQRIMSALGDLAGLLVGKGRDTINGMRNGVTSAWGLLKSWLGNMGQRVLTGIGNLGRTLYNAGRDLLQGLIDGIGSLAGKVVDAVTNPIGTAVDAGKSLLGIKSPSKVFAEIGENVGAGFVLGMSGVERDVANAARSLTGAALGDAIRPAVSVGVTADDHGSSSRGGLVIEHAEFGDRAVVRDLDLWARSKTAGV